MIRKNLTKLKTIDEDGWIKYVNMAYINNDGIKTVRRHSKVIYDIDDGIYTDEYYIEKYYGDILVCCCKYVSRNGGKFQKMWKEEYLSMGLRSHIRFKIKG